MRTTRQSEGQQSCFVLHDLDAELAQAATELYYLPQGEGYYKCFPRDGADMDRIYAHWTRSVEEMLAQQALRHPAPWQKALRAFLARIQNEDLCWFLGGSGALAVRGLDITPRDIDLITDEAGAQRLAAILSDVLVEPLQRSEGWIADWFGRAFFHARIEWVGDVQNHVDDGAVTDFGPMAAAHLEAVSWEGYEILVPPLALQCEVSERRGLADRAAIIRRAMSESKDRI
jgi:hypothetical protein